MAHPETSGSKRSIDSGEQSIDRIGGRSEEVDIAGLTLDVAADDQCATAAECKVCGLIQARDDRGDLLLQGTEHATRGGGC